MKVLKILSILLISLFGMSIDASSVLPEPKNKPIVVALIDTGINPDLKDQISLCKYGHRDYTGQGLDDANGHGSHLAGLIDSYAKNTIIDYVSIVKVNYCLVILKIIDSGNQSDGFRGIDPLANEIKALRFAINIKVDVINLSLSGVTPSKEETLLIKEALDKGIKIVVAAGNFGQEIGSINAAGIKVDVYPAIDDERLVVVGSILSNGKRTLTSNYGPIVKTWEHGHEAVSFCATGLSYCSMSGTSQSTAIKTGKIVWDMLRHR
jgi:subtilisin